MQKGYPRKARTYDDLATGDGEKFLILNGTVIPDNNTPNAKRVLVFMSSFGRDFLAPCPSCNVDGTFKPSKSTLFSQIAFVIGQTATGFSVPCGFALLPNKENNTYLRVAEAIKSELQQAEQDIQTMGIKTDFEKGLIGAFGATFDQAVVVACDFHWKACILKRLEDGKLMELYNSDTEFHRLVRYIWSLSYVPPEHVVPIWESFIQEKVAAGASLWKKSHGGGDKVISQVCG